jgi:hypothetical protein
MNFKIVAQVIEIIERRSTIDEESIKANIGISLGYIRNEFKKIIGLSLDEYRIRRQLSIIIIEIKKSGKKFNRVNLFPWSSYNSFYKAFKKKYHIAPNKFIKEYNEEVLEKKIDIKLIELKYSREYKRLEDLITEYGSEYKVANMLLSLPPYSIYKHELMCIDSRKLLQLFLIRDKYKLAIKDRTFIEKIPCNFYEQNKNLLDDFYDLKNRLTLEEGIMVEHDFHNEPDSTKVEVYLNSLYEKEYFLVNRNLINGILDKTNYKEFMFSKINPSMLRTIWFEEISVLLWSKVFPDGRVIVPVRFNNMEFTDIRRNILMCIFEMEQGLVTIETWELLLCDLKLEFTMSHYREAYFEMPEYLKLNISFLINEVSSLIREGFIYLESK